MKLLGYITIAKPVPVWIQLLAVVSLVLLVFVLPLIYFAEGELLSMSKLGLVPIFLGLFLIARKKTNKSWIRKLAVVGPSIMLFISIVLVGIGSLKDLAYGPEDPNKRYIKRLHTTNCCMEDNFGGANLSGSDLFEKNFTGANLKEANLSHTNLIRTDFSGANLTGASLAGAYNISEAIFCNTTMPDGTVNNSGC